MCHKLNWSLTSKDALESAHDSEAEQEDEPPSPSIGRKGVIVVQSTTDPYSEGSEASDAISKYGTWTVNGMGS